MYKVIVKTKQSEEIMYFTRKVECEQWVQQNIIKGKWGDPGEYKVTIVEDEAQLLKERYEKFIDNRNKVLKSTDWTQLADTLITKPKLKRVYREYRQYLRDLPRNVDPRAEGSLKITTFEEFLDIKWYIKGKDYER